MTTSEHEHPLDGIAIVGMAGRFPGATTVEQFWHNLCAGVDAISSFRPDEVEPSVGTPDLRHLPNYVAARGILDDVAGFDAAFFGFNAREAEITDPQHRLFLECAWEALEQAGSSAETRKAIGVFAGATMSSYLFNVYTDAEAVASLTPFQIMIANDKDHMPTRVSYKLNLRGPSVAVQTACSTSLVAVHLACQSLLNGECDIALAGGASITVPQRSGYLYQAGGITAPDGCCRPFDDHAQGTVFSNGVGVVVLKPLAAALDDNDTIYAVIRGSAINNDGAQKVGYTAPSVDGQAAVIVEAQQVAGVAADTISYVEAHGTGTPLGDPIELAALSQAFGGNARTATCALGAVKSNIGHLDSAAGVAGLIKTTLALHHGQLPPTLHCDRPTHLFDFDHSPFTINTRLRPWTTEHGPRRAGVSSFGMGGTNAHIVLEQAPARVPSGPDEPWQVLLLSARTPTALHATAARLRDYLAHNDAAKLADVAATLQTTRRGFEQRCAVVCRDRADALDALATPARWLSAEQRATERSVAFLFPGQGAQYVGMGRELYATELVFRATVDRCATTLAPRLGYDLRDILYPADDQNQAARELLRQTSIAQPALFVVSYALAQLWMAWGVQPCALLGHSIGQYVAACLAGVFTLDDALLLVAARGQLMQALPAGAMLSVALDERAMQPLLGNELALAAVNGPAQCVVSGTEPAISQLADRLFAQGVECRRLHTSHAFHSEMMAPAIAPFAQIVASVPRSAPTIPFISNRTGTWATTAEATDPLAWAQHLCDTVRFGDGLNVLAQHAEWALLEVGPGNTASTFARQATRAQAQPVIASMRHPHDATGDLATARGAQARLWLAGATLDWDATHRPHRRWRVPLPTYPFERQAYWINGSTPASAPTPATTPIVETDVETLFEAPLAAATNSTLYERPALNSAYVAPENELEHTLVSIWEELLGVAPIGIYDNFFELGGHSLLATQVSARIHATFNIEFPMRALIAAPTIITLAAEIEALLIEQLEQLSDDEVMQLV